MLKLPRNIDSLYSFNTQKPPFDTFVWVTNGIGAWTEARLHEDGSWTIKPGDNYKEFSFHYWTPIVSDVITSFKEWFAELND